LMPLYRIVFGWVKNKMKYLLDTHTFMLISQAITNDLVLLSKDENFASYPVKCLW
jgi:hypothetical protein